jgi:O-antigen/teichoic acid export membrane protein
LLPEGLGKVNFANAIISYFALIAGLGIGRYGVRESAKIRNDRIALSKLASEIFTINMIAIVVAYLLFIAALFLVPKFKEYQPLLCICSASILFGTLGMEWLYGALEEYRYITIRSVLFQFISLALLFLLVKKKDDYIVYAGISVFASVGSNILNFIRSLRFIDLHIVVNKGIVKHLKPIFVLFAMALTISIYTILDTTMLGFIIGDTAVGIYSAAVKIDKIVLALIIAFSTVLLPRLSFYAEKNNSAQFLKLIDKSFSFLLCFSVPSTVGLCLLSRPLILLLSGEQYIPAIPVMMVMSPIVIVISISNLIGIQIFMSIGKEKLSLYSVIIGAIINFTLNVVLIPRLAAFGAGISTLCTETLVTVSMILMAKKYFSLREITINLFQFIISTVGMIIVIALVLYVISEIVLQIILSFLIGSIVYIGLLILMKNMFINSIITMVIKRIKL